MGKRVTKAEAQLVVWVVIVGLPIYFIAHLGKSIGWGAFVGIAIVIIALIIWSQSVQTKKRREGLMAKYNDESLVDLIMKKSFWQGQTSAQLHDSLGAPADIDEKVLKTKKKEVWKYNPQGGNRYGLRITLDNDVVVGWDQKS